MIELIVIAWLGCGVLQWGLMYAFFSRKWPSVPESRVGHIVWAVFGPVVLFAAVVWLAIVNGWKDAFKYGFKL